VVPVVAEAAMNTTVRHLALVAGYGHAQGYLELRWHTRVGMSSEHFAVSALDRPPPAPGRWLPSTTSTSAPRRAHGRPMPAAHQ
jgi:hypothetical protein